MNFLLYLWCEGLSCLPGRIGSSEVLKLPKRDWKLPCFGTRSAGKIVSHSQTQKCILGVRSAGKKGLAMQDYRKKGSGYARLATLSSGRIVGHIPRKILPICSMLYSYRKQTLFRCFRARWFRNTVPAQVYLCKFKKIGRENFGESMKFAKFAKIH